MINITQEEIMQNWGVDNSDAPLVSVKCMTYNHEKYISQALDGFLMQKTNFPFEVLVHDDASTDKTADIIRKYETKYPKIIKGIYETENQYSKGKGAHHVKIDAAIKGKYVAFCEGDDYWIDENKLQMQVDFLEKNPEYGLVYSKIKPFYQKLNKFDKVIGKKVINVNQLIKKGNVIPTCSVLLKKEFYFQYINEIKPFEKGWLMGDYPMNLWFMCNSKIKFFPQIMGVYRILSKSASHSDNFDFLIRFAQSTNDILEFFKEHYNISIKLPDHVMLTKFCYYLARNDREKILQNADFSKLPKQPFIVKVKIFIYKRDLLYKIYRIIKKHDNKSC